MYRWFLVFLISIIFIVFPAFCRLKTNVAIAATVNCNAPALTGVAGGGALTFNVDCVFSGTGIGIGVNIGPLASNKVTPSSLNLIQGAYTVLLNLQPTVTSPNNTISITSGTASGGFTGIIIGTPPTFRFQYTGTTAATTPSGIYTSTAPAYSWSILSLINGSSPFTLQATIPVATFVSCASSNVNALAGGGSFIVPVTCTLVGNATSLSPANSNKFNPLSLSLINGSSTLNTTLQSTITSPDNTITNLSGTASGGFTGTIQASPAKLQVQYSGTTSATTQSGMYTSPAINMLWNSL